MGRKRTDSQNVMAQRVPFWGIVLIAVVTGGLVADATRADGDNFYSDLIRLDRVVNKVHQNYVEEVPSDDLVNKAIEGMLEILDPHTSFFEKKEYDELRIHTEGKFGGLGIQISIRDKVLTIMTPISGTPASRAGVQSGDQIIRIDGTSTKGITIDEAVQQLRGKPGTDVTITIRRTGEEKDHDVTITREIIHIRAVPYYGMLENVGYVRLNTFSQEAGSEVEKAIKALVRNDVAGMIFDLRANPGGLLPQAIEVAEKFLPKKALIVQTRGRAAGQDKEFFASSNPVLPQSLPLVILVDRASASASEIVSGAVQDWDRGIILGDTTFGKGSVQTILSIGKKHHLKLTTAYYYTPSGRCINRPENSTRGNGEGETENSAADSMAAEEGDSGTAGDTAAQEIFTTKNGRIVNGGGGIIPDTVIERPSLSQVERVLFGKNVFFKFANVMYPRLRKRGVSIDQEFEVDSTLLDEFRTFLDSLDVAYKNFVQVKFREFLSQAGLIDTVFDSTEATIEKPEWTPRELADLKELSGRINTLLAGESRREFGEEREDIRRHIRNAFLTREFGQDHEIMYRARLDHDIQLKSAVALLNDTAVYRRLLGPRQ